MDLGLGNARVLLVGGSRGMGRAAAETFAREGARVAVLARPSEALDDTVETLRSLGSPESVPLAADLTNLNEVDSAIDELGERWNGGLEVLVNTAGPVDVGIGPFDGLGDDEWRATLEIGLLSAVRTVRRSLPLLRRGSFARIVNLSAHSTKRQSPDLVAYTAAKAALSSLTKNLSQSLAPEGILVNTVSPGSFLSEGMQGYLQSLPPERGVDSTSLTDAMRVIAEDFGHPAYLGRAGNPAEIGPVIAFLGSSVNSYMTGADVNVDGGSDFT
jgi:3-oxoacyl-[acyl-carrier protein] reductase